MTAKQLLEEIRELIADPVNWTQGTLARDVDGKRVSPADPGAFAFCPIGAFAVVERRHEAYGIESCQALKALQETIVEIETGDEPDPEWRYHGLANFNDTHDHAAVLDALDRAIASCG